MHIPTSPLPPVVMPDPPVRDNTLSNDPNEDFINYNQVVENQATDDPTYPRLPFVPNIPTSMRYFPLMMLCKKESLVKSKKQLSVKKSQEKVNKKSKILTFY